MYFREWVREIQKKKESLVCVGLDSGLDRIPPLLIKRASGPAIAVLNFNRTIIDVTADLVCAYKPNFAFYEAQGPDGLEAMRGTIQHIHKHTNVPVILDIKRGDIGSTAEAYARAAFEVWEADAVTVNPLMGYDAVEPFLGYADRGKGVILLGETSNPGASDFQTQVMSSGLTLSETIVARAVEWGVNGIVVGATIPEGHMQRLREKGQNLLWLVPGIGTQGGDAEVILRYGSSEDGIGPIINSSRGIICHWRNRSDLGFDEAARVATEELRNRLNGLKVPLA